MLTFPSVAVDECTVKSMCMPIKFKLFTSQISFRIFKKLSMLALSKSLVISIQKVSVSLAKCWPCTEALSLSFELLTLFGSQLYSVLLLTLFSYEFHPSLEINSFE